MNTPKPLPPVTEELLEYLKRIFPLKTPEFKTPDREIWYRIGEQSVIAELEAVYRKLKEQ